MDNSYIYSFLNSQAIKNHFEEINFTPTAVQAAWIILHNFGATMKAKHEGLRYLLNDVADEPFPYNHHLDENEFESLHDYIQQKLNYDADIIWKCQEANPFTVYQWRFLYHDNDRYTDFDDSMLYSSPIVLRNAVRKELEEYSSDCLESDGIEFYCVRRRTLESPTYIDSIFNLNHDLIDFEVHCSDDDHNFRIADGLRTTWMNFPVPFKPGDIVHDVGTYRKSAPMLLTSTTQGKIQECPDYRGSDDSDMNVYGYFLSGGDSIPTVPASDGIRLFQDVTWNYMDYDYVPEEELIGNYRIFKVLREIAVNEAEAKRKTINDIEFLLVMYHHILLEDALKNSGIDWFISDYVKQFGVDPDKYRDHS